MLMMLVVGRWCSKQDGTLTRGLGAFAAQLGNASHQAEVPSLYRQGTRLLPLPSPPYHRRYSCLYLSSQSIALSTLRCSLAASRMMVTFGQMRCWMERKRRLLYLRLPGVGSRRPKFCTTLAWTGNFMSDVKRGWQLCKAMD